MAFKTVFSVAASGLIMCGMCVGEAAAQAGDVEHARPRLIAEMAGVTPGSTTYIGVSFEIDPGWHMYWNGANDTGFAPAITWSVPRGVEVGKPMWPTPKRHVSPGDILDHVYYDRLTLIMPVKIPESAEAGTHLQLTADMEWLVCQEACIPGEATLTLKLPVLGKDASPKRSADAGLFAAVRSAQPRELADIAKNVTISWQGRDVVKIRATGAKQLVFYPGLDAARLVNALADGEAKGDTMTLRLDGEMNGELPLEGLLEVRAEPGRAGPAFKVRLDRGQTTPAATGNGHESAPKRVW